MREPHPYASYLHVSRTLGSGQAHPHHPKAVVYRCYLPILAEFTDFRRAEPIHQCFQNWPLQPRIHRTRPEIGKGGIRTRDRVTPIHALQACALNQTQPPFQTDLLVISKKKRAQEDSNLWPPDPQSDALSKLSYGRISSERGGFEPPVPVTQYDSLANCWFKPLTHLSKRKRRK